MIVYGKQILLYILEKHSKKLKKIYLSKEIDKKLFARLAACAEIVKVDNKKAQALARGGNHQGMIAEIEPVVPFGLEDVQKFNKIALLVGVNDIGNIGSVIRTAFGYGLDAVAVCGRRELSLEPIIRVSSGAALDMPVIFEPDCAVMLNKLKQLKFELICSKIDGKDVVVDSEKWVLVMGSEDTGIPSKLHRFCNQSVGIAMQNSFDSLNVSVAAGILIDRIVHGRGSQ